MKPEMILRSDLIDILFDGRNKMYGAYTLRKGYANRLVKSMAVTFLLSLLLCVFLVMENEKDIDTWRPLSLPVIDVDIKDLEFVKPPEQAAKQQVQTKTLAQASNTTVKMIPDQLVDKPVKTQEELDGKIIGVADVEGEDGSDLPPLALQPTGNGLAIAAAPKPIEEVITGPFTVVEEMPEFPGGKEAFQKFLVRHLRQPDNLDEGVKVMVRVRFVIDEEGRIGKLQILESGDGLEKEVVRVVNKMPVWKPGRQNGRKVSVYFILPVTFVGANVAE